MRVVLPTLALVAGSIIAVSLNLDAVQNGVSALYAIIAGEFSWVFVISNLACVGFTVWAVFGKCSKTRLGDISKPKYSMFTWIAMMFTTSCSAGLILFGFIEPLYYASNPPFEIQSFTNTAWEYAEMYAHFHWGLNAWSLYVPASIAIAYVFYNLRKKSVSMASACEPVLKNKPNGFVSSFIDTMSTFGVVVAPVTSMGLGLPLVVLLVQTLFGVSDEYTQTIQIVVLIVWMVVFGSSVFLGLDKGIKNLSNANVVVAFAFMIVVGLLAGVFTVFKAEINSLGLYASNLIRMSTYTDPYGTGEFVSTWTVWYWAWLTVYMPLMGVLVARISEGRTVRQVALGVAVACSLGCFVAIMTLGNYTIQVQRSGIVDAAAILANDGQAAAIVAILQTMPFPEVAMVVLVVLCFIFMATTVDSSSFVAAELTAKKSSTEALAPRSSRLLWALVACVITFVLLQIGGFSAVQTLALLVGLPLSIVMLIVIVSAVKLLRHDVSTDLALGDGKQRGFLNRAETPLPIAPSDDEGKEYGAR